MYRFRKRLSLAGIACTALMLSGCATNVLRLDYATNVAASGKAAAAASRQYLTELEDGRIEANIDIIEADPNCVPRVAFIRLAPDLSGSNPGGEPERGWLCGKKGDPATSELSLASLGPELEPTFQVVSALGAYSDSISRILSDEGVDIAQDFRDTLALLRAAEGTACALGAGSADPATGTCTKPAVPGEDDVRVEAVNQFLGFVGELANEQSKVDQLRLLADSEEGSARLIATLRDHLANWEVSRRSDIALRTLLAQSMMAQSFSAEPPMSSSRRRAAAKNYYDRERVARTELQVFAALDGMLIELAQTDEDLRRVLAENPDLTPEEKAVVAREFRSRATRAFDSVTNILLAFKGG